MSGVVIRGQRIEIAGLQIMNWFDDSKLRLDARDYRKRPDTWVRGIVLHTTKGIPGGRIRTPQDIRPGFGPNTRRDERLAQMWAMDSRRAGAHIAVDHDGSICCFADLQEEAAFHAGNVNNVTIGIEIYQGSKGELYEGQLDNVVKLVDALTALFSIQRQIHWPYKRHAIKRGLRRGIDMVGVYGHRDCSNNRGEGDPGNRIMEMLVEAGYESFDFSEDEDKEVWMDRQEKLGLLADGIPGPRTAAKLAAEGYKKGLWVARGTDV